MDERQIKSLVSKHVHCPKLHPITLLPQQIRGKRQGEIIRPHACVWIDATSSPLLDIHILEAQLELVGFEMTNWTSTTT